MVGPEIHVDSLHGAIAQDTLHSFVLACTCSLAAPRGRFQPHCSQSINSVLMKTLLRKAERIPFDALPYGFQNRMIVLAPFETVKAFSEVCENVKKFRHIRPEPYDQVFITDNEAVYNWASKDTFLFRMFIILQQFSLLKYIYDGSMNINPIWQVVLRVDDIVARRQHIYVEDTLVVYCDSIDSYKNVIPFIHGPYSRVVLHGEINVNQVRQIIRPTVKKVRINARIVMLPEDDFGFATFVAEQVHGFNSSFVFTPSANLTDSFRAWQKAACRPFKHTFYDTPCGIFIEDRRYLVHHTFAFFIFTWVIFLSPSWLLILLKCKAMLPFMLIQIALSCAMSMVMGLLTDTTSESELYNGGIDSSTSLMRTLWNRIDAKLLKIYITLTSQK